MAKKPDKFYYNRNFYIGLGGAIVGGILFLLLLDNVIMPAYTNYDEGVTVPNITRLPLEEAQQMITSSGLRYEIAERRSNDLYPANYVIDQNPTPSEIVKPNRKIYLTVNVVTNPTVEVPNVTDLSLRNAKIQLENAGLEVGTISYESSRFKNTVLRQSIEPNKVVKKGISVDLAVSDGLGEDMVNMPEIVGLRLSEAQQMLREAGLRVGEIQFKPSDNVAPNIILDYFPKQYRVIEGQTLKLIVSERSDAIEEDEAGAVINPQDTTNQNSSKQ